MGLITDTDVGLASLNTDTYASVELLAGDTPPIVTDSAPIAAGILTSGLPARSVVTLDANGNVTGLAVLGTTQATAITVVSINAGSSSGTKVPVYRAGCFNPAALNWDATYNTDEKKRLAFNAAVGSQIFIKKNPYA